MSRPPTRAASCEEPIQLSGGCFWAAQGRNQLRAVDLHQNQFNSGFDNKSNSLAGGTQENSTTLTPSGPKTASTRCLCCDWPPPASALTAQTSSQDITTRSYREQIGEPLLRTATARSAPSSHWSRRRSRSPTGYESLSTLGSCTLKITRADAGAPREHSNKARQPARAALKKRWASRVSAPSRRARDDACARRRGRRTRSSAWPTRRAAAVDGVELAAHDARPLFRDGRRRARRGPPGPLGGGTRLVRLRARAFSGRRPARAITVAVSARRP